MIRLAGYLWEALAVWFLAAFALAACWAGYRAVGKRLQCRTTAAARKRRVLHHIEHSDSAVPTVRGHAYLRPRKDTRP